MMPGLTDIDTPDDLMALCARIRSKPALGARLKHTREGLRKIGEI